MNAIQSLGRLLIRYEWLLFVIAVAIIVSDIFANKWLLTEDGGSHLYNAVIMKELLSSDPFIEQHYQLNHLPIPNLLGYVLMLFFNLFVSLSVCDQLIHFLSIAGLCYAFRYLVTQINPAKKYHSWLIFPFVYSVIFNFGFYNYSLGLALCLFCIGMWISMEDKPVNKKRLALLLLCCTLLYFTHMIPFLLLIITAGIRILFFIYKDGIRKSFIKGCLLTVVLLPGFIFYFIFHLTRPSENHITTFPNPEFVIKTLASLNLLIHDLPALDFFLKLFSCILAAAIVTGIIILVVRRKNIFPAAKNNFIFWGICWALMTLLAFITPDGFSGGSIVTIRLLEISSLFMIVWVASGALPTQLFSVLALFALTIGIMQMQYRHKEHEDLNRYAHDVENFAPYVEEGHTGAYLTFVGNWKHLHIGEVLFAEKKCVSLSNYEAFHDYFPVQWNDSLPYNYMVGGLNSFQKPCMNFFWPEHPEKPAKNIDYILLAVTYLNPSDSGCVNPVFDSIEKNYDLLKRTDELSLYRSKDFRK